MQEQKIIKTIVPHICPHCSKEIMIANRVVVPIIDWVLKRSDLNEAKKRVLSMVENIKFANEKEKVDIIAWIKNEETVFGPAEVEGIITQLTVSAAEQMAKEKVEEGDKEKKQEDKQE